MKRDLTILIILLVFWVMWLYTELAEYNARSDFNQEVMQFMARGDRFTQQDADVLEKEINTVQEDVERLNEIIESQKVDDGGEVDDAGE